MRKPKLNDPISEWWWYFLIMIWDPIIRKSKKPFNAIGKRYRIWKGRRRLKKDGIAHLVDL